MKSPQGKSKKRVNYNQLPVEKKLAIAQWIIDHPDVQIKQIAIDNGLTYNMVWRIIKDFIDIKKVMSLKRPTEAAERPSEDPLPQ
jgi:hypothetical protein